MADSSLTPAALRQGRERTIAALSEHFARDHLEAEELERLIDRALNATSLAELDTLLAGFPALDAPPRAAELARPRPAVAAREHQVVAAIMGGVERRGGWTPARHTHVVAIMGGVELDLREAHLAEGVTEINVVAIMGGVEIVVPPGIQVESNGIGIMGGFEHSGRGTIPVDANVPVLRISGLAFWAGVEIKERLPGESSADARRRLRAERRDQRRLERGLRGEPRDGSNWGGWDR